MIRRVLLMALGIVLFAQPGSPVLAMQNVVVSILPLQTFVERIGGDAVQVTVMVQPGASPATYEPTPRQMQELGSAAAYFAMGVPFETVWLERMAGVNPELRIVHVDQGIEKMAMTAHSHHEEGYTEEQGHGHDQGIPDPHVWLSPELVKTVARNICQALQDMDPEKAGLYGENLESFLVEISALQQELHLLLDPLQGSERSFMVFHPSWGYFAHEFGLVQIPIETQGKEPGPGELAAIIAEGRELSIPVVFVQPQFSERSARVIASELDAEVLSLDSLAMDWAENLIRAAKAFVDSRR